MVIGARKFPTCLGFSGALNYRWPSVKAGVSLTVRLLLTRLDFLPQCPPLQSSWRNSRSSRMFHQDRVHRLGWRYREDRLSETPLNGIHLTRPTLCSQIRASCGSPRWPQLDYRLLVLSLFSSTMSLSLRDDAIRMLLSRGSRRVNAGRTYLVPSVRSRRKNTLVPAARQELWVASSRGRHGPRDVDWLLTLK